MHWGRVSLATGLAFVGSAAHAQSSDMPPPGGGDIVVLGSRGGAHLAKDSAFPVADVDGDRVRLRTNAIVMLQRRELLRAGDELAGGLGKSFVEARAGEVIEGRLTRRVDLASGRFAVVEKSHEFTLVPWRPMLENWRGKTMSGVTRADGVSWRFGRNRGGPEIS